MMLRKQLHELHQLHVFNKKTCNSCSSCSRKPTITINPNFNIDNTEKETLEKMVEINPALQDLIDELGLVEV